MLLHEKSTEISKQSEYEYAGQQRVYSNSPNKHGYLQGMSIQYYWYFQYFQNGIGYWYFQYFWYFCQIKVLVLNTFIFSDQYPILFILKFFVFFLGSEKENWCLLSIV